ncbi:hypothetical protein [Pedobacter punctiformis]|uniref:Immunity protein 63 domain-containing protein n=1 Tax=Pedobacter punctiformis TaxID=3004097 RepID=A0ABT4LC19_9SPHI|nr:hypothetical protein [Pedobacter sp. HCMS5-2]MCZ4245438.1 hypothetical protein [Pedobacter sp. HCMS5-2]
MQNKILLKDLLIANHFELIEDINSGSFGDFYCTYSNGDVLIRMVRDRSSTSLDIGTIKDNKLWFDLGLIKALIYKENDLKKVFAIEDSINFLEQHLQLIKMLFNHEKYSSTKAALEDLENKRVAQMFPSKKNYNES